MIAPVSVDGFDFHYGDTSIQVYKNGHLVHTLSIATGAHDMVNRVYDFLSEVVVGEITCEQVNDQMIWVWSGHWKPTYQEIVDYREGVLDSIAETERLEAKAAQEGMEL